MTGLPVNRQAADMQTADRVADILAPVERTNPTARYLVREAVLEGIRAERARVWNEERRARIAEAREAHEAVRAAGRERGR